MAEIEVAEEYVDTVVEMLGKRRGRMTDMRVGEDGTNYLTYLVPTRGLLGFRGQFLTATRGIGTMHTLFHGYEPWFGEIEMRDTGSLVAYDTGVSTAYALDNVQLRGQLFIGPGVEVYEGMVVGRHSRPGDLALNACKKKHLTKLLNNPVVRGCCARQGRAQHPSSAPTF